MRLELRHSTIYEYSEAISGGLQQLRLTPKSGPGQTVEDWSVEIAGASKEATFEDQHGNHTELIALDPGQRVEINVRGSVVTENLDGVIGKHLSPLAVDGYLRSTPLTRTNTATHLSRTFASEHQRETLDRLHRLSKRIIDEVEYVPGHTGPNTTAEESLALGKGVCQDHAQIFITTARVFGVPARYVSGYLMMPDQIDQAATHAWAEAYIDDLGWVGFDVSNQISPDERYVRLATGLDYREAAPISGMRIGGDGETLNVEVTVSTEPIVDQNQQ